MKVSTPIESITLVVNERWRCNRGRIWLPNAGALIAPALEECYCPDASVIQTLLLSSRFYRPDPFVVQTLLLSSRSSRLAASIVQPLLGPDVWGVLVEWS
jgi:hypothetical protein